MAPLPAGGSGTPAGRAPGTAGKKRGRPRPTPARGSDREGSQPSRQRQPQPRPRSQPEAESSAATSTASREPQRLLTAPLPGRPRAAGGASRRQKSQLAAAPPPALPPPAGSGRASPGRRVTGMRKPFPGERRFRRWLDRGSRVGRTERCSRDWGPLCERRRGPQVSSCPGAEREKPRRCRAWLRWPALGPEGGRGLRSAAVPAPFPRRKLPRPFPAGRRFLEDLRAAGGGREAGAGHCPARPGPAPSLS